MPYPNRSGQVFVKQGHNVTLGDPVKCSSEIKVRPQTGTGKSKPPPTKQPPERTPGADGHYYPSHDSSK